MPDYGEILRFLAQNPPQLDAERKVHASLLELLAQCLREDLQVDGEDGESLEERIANAHINWVHFN
ncbi:MAG: hypothetical protein MI861_00475 [Pirellulales bacterium]|nr:hypothetical protein [Pirellulales bacterium]